MHSSSLPKPSTCIAHYATQPVAVYSQDFGFAMLVKTIVLRDLNRDEE